MKTSTRRRALAITAVTALSGIALLSGCAGSPSASSSEGETEVAYLSSSSANTWLSASGKAMQEEAKKAGIKITEFDAKFEPGKSVKQIQDVVASKKYKGIIIATSDGPGAIPALQKAMDAGIKVVILNQVVGEKLDTADPQVPGFSASVLAPPKGTGERLGKLALKACDGLEECKVVYMYGLKGTPFDTAVRDGFDSTITGNSKIKVVADTEGGFLGTAEPRKAVQDVLQSNPNFDVFVAAGDQQVRGAQLALGDAGKPAVKTIGVGASEPALKGISEGTWFGDVAGVPADEGRAALNAMVKAIKENKDSGGIDVVDDLPDGGLITKENVAKFTAQWAG
ncbi:sugar ABC transporter substrate-binding protein [Paenarthrobacter sp. YJN-5]|uniref:sugar ABC transporter substrate-binding protein n=2 Tax=unclassified Paenarthrobacter TaxID=2634190 RepID=UPI0018780DD4|nr:sugar ABC transporter substrate-binding protein [Paenarthrobacter sp. YJN-5]QOT19929.1 sugar ABC transporter substrate-binding protein [Paenarthrobacter sp. YJN-5]